MIHRALRLLRVYHNLKQKDLATALGISPSYLCEIEAGHRTVTYDLLEKYAAQFRMPVSNIAFFAEADANGSGKKMVRRITDRSLHFLEWLENLSTDASAT